MTSCLERCHLNVASTKNNPKRIETLRVRVAFALPDCLSYQQVHLTYMINQIWKPTRYFTEQSLLKKYMEWLLYDREQKIVAL